MTVDYVAMHMSDGIINAPISLLFVAVAVVAVGLCAWRARAELDERTVPLAGLVALSTYLPGGAAAAAQRHPNAVAQPVFFAHGDSDPVIPVQYGQASAQMLERAGFEVQWHRYPMAHQVCAEEIRDLGDWMQRRFVAAGAAG